MNYYEVLQINKDASEEVIKAAYKALIKKYHPDNASGADVEKVKLLNEAYDVLSDEKSRKEYDESLKNTYGTNGFYSNHSSEFEQGDGQETNGRRHFEDDYMEDDSDDGYEKYEKKGFFGKIFASIERDLQQKQGIIKNAYFDGVKMDDYELVNAVKKSYGLKRVGYERAMVEKGLLYKDYEGKYRPTERLKRLW